MEAETDYTIEWAIFGRDGELHRGPWSEVEARTWLEECVEMGIRSSAFQLRCRVVGPWKERLDSLAREALVWENPEIMASLRRGLEQAARGEVEDRGSFEQYLDKGPDDES